VVIATGPSPFPPL